MGQFLYGSAKTTRATTPDHYDNVSAVEQLCRVRLRFGS